VLVVLVDAPKGSVDSADRPPEQAAANISNTLKRQTLGRTARDEISI
jgi:hypothetical protein